MGQGKIRIISFVVIFKSLRNGHRDRAYFAIADGMPIEVCDGHNVHTGAGDEHLGNGKVNRDGRFDDRGRGLCHNLHHNLFGNAGVSLP